MFGFFSSGCTQCEQAVRGFSALASVLGGVRERDTRTRASAVLLWRNVRCRVDGKERARACRRASKRARARARERASSSERSCRPIVRPSASEQGAHAATEQQAGGLASVAFGRCASVGGRTLQRINASHPHRSQAAESLPGSNRQQCHKSVAISSSNRVRRAQNAPNCPSNLSVCAPFLRCSV